MATLIHHDKILVCDFEHHKDGSISQFHFDQISQYRYDMMLMAAVVSLL